MLLAAVGVWLVLLWAWSVSAAGAVDEGDHAGAADSYERQRALTPLGPERWKAHYNLGTARLAQERNVDAEESLRTALELAPKAAPDPDGLLDPQSAECKVRTNLAISLEQMAIDAESIGVTTAADSYRAEAADVIEPCIQAGQGEEETSEPPSGSPSEPPSPSESPSPSGSPSPSPSPTPSPSDPRLEELQERNDRAREEAEQGQGEGGGFGGGQNW